MNEKEQLHKLLEFIELLCNDPKNAWFKKELLAKLGSGNNQLSFPEFLKHQKIQFRNKGKAFYESIEDKKLKQKLVEDYTYMSWYWFRNEVARSLTYAYYQLENLLNYYCLNSNCYEKLKYGQNPLNYTHQFQPTFTVICHNNFFYNSQEQAIGKVSFWAKITYWMFETNDFDFIKNYHQNLSDLNNVRNFQSHRNSALSDESTSKKITHLKNASIGNIGFYTNILKTVVESLPNISTEVKEIAPRPTPDMKPPKTFGKIELSEKDTKRFNKK